MIESPTTFPEYLRSARLERMLSQAELARHLGVTESTIWNWEDGRSTPPAHGCKVVIAFLGFDPFPVPAGEAGRLVAYRRKAGLRVRDAADLAGVAPSTWSSWEKA